MKMPKLSKPAILLIIAALCIVIPIIAYAAYTYTMTAPVSDSVEVVSQATLSKVTVSATSITVGDSLTLSTTVSDQTSGITVTFLNNHRITVGTGTTNAQGTASCTFQPTAGIWTFAATATHP